LLSGRLPILDGIFVMLLGVAFLGKICLSMDMDGVSCDSPWLPNFLASHWWPVCPDCSPGCDGGAVASTLGFCGPHRSVAASSGDIVIG